MHISYKKVNDYYTHSKVSRNSVFRRYGFYNINSVKPSPKIPPPEFKGSCEYISDIHQPVFIQNNYKVFKKILTDINL